MQGANKLQAEVQELCDAQPGARGLTHTLGTGALARSRCEDEPRWQEDKDTLT